MSNTNPLDVLNQTTVLINTGKQTSDAFKNATGQVQRVPRYATSQSAEQAASANRIVANMTSAKAALMLAKYNDYELALLWGGLTQGQQIAIKAKLTPEQSTSLNSRLASFYAAEGALPAGYTSSNFESYVTPQAIQKILAKDSAQIYATWFSYTPEQQAIIRSKMTADQLKKLDEVIASNGTQGGGSGNSDINWPLWIGIGVTALGGGYLLLNKSKISLKGLTNNSHNNMKDLVPSVAELKSSSIDVLGVGTGLLAVYNANKTVLAQHKSNPLVQGLLFLVGWYGAAKGTGFVKNAAIGVAAGSLFNTVHALSAKAQEVLADKAAAGEPVKGLAGLAGQINDVIAKYVPQLSGMAGAGMGNAGAMADDEYLRLLGASGMGNAAPASLNAMLS